MSQLPFVAFLALKKKNTWCGNLTSMLGTSRDSSGPFPANLLPQSSISAANVARLRLRWKGNNAVHVAALLNKLGFAVVPFFQHLMRWGTSQDARMDQAGELDARDVTRAAVYAFKVPDCLGSAAHSSASVPPGVVSGDRIRLGVDLIQKSTTILFCKYTSETPRLVWQGLNVLDLNEKNITGLSRLDLEGSAQIMDSGEVNVSDIVGAVIVADLAARPVNTLDTHGFAILDSPCKGDVGMPSILCTPPSASTRTNSAFTSQDKRTHMQIVTSPSILVGVHLHQRPQSLFSHDFC